jgi:hypothetical protein
VKGIILNLVEEAIVAEHGDDTWDSLLDASGSDGAYTSLGNYPDDDLERLVNAGADVLEVEPRDLSRHLGQVAIQGLAERYPQYFSPHHATMPFLLTLDDVIHTEVRKLYADSSPPDFWFDDPIGNVLVVHYRSQRRLCALAEGMMIGATAHYEEQVSIAHESCMFEGADHCILRVTVEEG